MTRLYEREIKDFFEVAKIKMAGTTKEGKGKFGKIHSILSVLFVMQILRHPVCARRLSCVCATLSLACIHAFL